jgi:hypothetical protein
MFLLGLEAVQISDIIKIGMDQAKKKLVRVMKGVTNKKRTERNGERAASCLSCCLFILILQVYKKL